MMQPKAFVLAGGFGTRLREVIHGRPKVLATVEGRPFLEYTLRYLGRQGVTQIVLGVGYLAGYVREAFGDGRSLGLQIIYSEEQRPLGTAGAIKNAARFFRDDFFVLNGDTYVEVDLGQLYRFHRRAEADVTIVCTRTYHERGGLIEIDRSGKVSRFEAQPIRRRKRSLTNAGTYLFRPQVLKVLPSNQRSFLERDLFPTLLERGFRVFGFTVEGDYIDIGSPARYEEAKALLRKETDNPVRQRH